MDNITDITVSKQSKTRGLKPFKKGQSGNIKGRPKGSISITRAIKTKLQEIYPGNDLQEKQTYLKKIVDTIFENAIEKKDPRTLGQIWAYIDGKPKATLDLATQIDKTNLAELTDFFRKMGNPKIS